MGTHLAKSIWQKVRNAARGRLFWAVLFFSLGASTSFVAAGRPELLRSQDSADWAGAAANVLAVIVALGLGVYAAQQQGRSQKQRSHGAALVFYTPVSETLATLELIEEHADQIRASEQAATVFRDHLLKMPVLLPNDTMSFLADMPEGTAQLVALSAQRLSTSKLRLSIPALDGTPVAERLMRAAEFMRGTYLPLGSALHVQVYGNTPAPWRA